MCSIEKGEAGAFLRSAGNHGNFRGIGAAQPEARTSTELIFSWNILKVMTPWLRLCNFYIHCLQDCKVLQREPQLAKNSPTFQLHWALEKKRFEFSAMKPCLKLYFFIAQLLQSCRASCEISQTPFPQAWILTPRILCPIVLSLSHDQPQNSPPQ